MTCVYRTAAGVYCTRNRREGGRVVQEYVGTGEAARPTAEFDGLGRDETRSEGHRSWGVDRGEDRNADKTDTGRGPRFAARILIRLPRSASVTRIVMPSSATGKIWGKISGKIGQEKAKEKVKW